MPPGVHHRSDRHAPRLVAGRRSRRHRPRRTIAASNRAVRRTEPDRRRRGARDRRRRARRGRNGVGRRRGVRPRDVGRREPGRRHQVAVDRRSSDPVLTSLDAISGPRRTRLAIGHAPPSSADATRTTDAIWPGLQPGRRRPSMSAHSARRRRRRMRAAKRSATIEQGAGRADARWRRSLIRSRTDHDCGTGLSSRRSFTQPVGRWPGWSAPSRRAIGCEPARHRRTKRSHRAGAM